MLKALFTAAVLQSAVLLSSGMTARSEALIWCLYWVAITASMFIGCRLAISHYISANIKNGALSQRIAVIGANGHGYTLARYISTHGHEAIEFAGIFDDEPPRFDNPETTSASIMPARRIVDLVNLNATERLDAVVIALPLARFDELDGILRELYCLPVDIYVAPEKLTGFLSPGTLGVSTLGKHQLIKLGGRPLDKAQILQKSLFDKLIAGLLAIFLLPIIIAISIAIKLDSPGPVLFRQPRIGLHGAWFTVFKFRSMYFQMSDLMADRQTSRDDPRVTRVGRILRKLSLDELPQLLNIFQGDISLVGPRPHAPSTKAEGHLLHDVVPSYAERHRVKPGLTGWAQVNGARGEIKSIREIEQRVELDLFYSANWSLLFDVKILFLTLRHELISSRAF